MPNRSITIQGADKAEETRAGWVTAQQFGGVTNQWVTQHVARGQRGVVIGAAVV